MSHSRNVNVRRVNDSGLLLLFGPILNLYPTIFVYTCNANMNIKLPGHHMLIGEAKI